MNFTHVGIVEVFVGATVFLGRVTDNLNNASVVRTKCTTSHLHGGIVRGELRSETRMCSQAEPCLGLHSSPGL